MIYRKTWFDYVLWVIYAGICIILLGYVGYSMYSFYVGEPLASLGVFVLVALLLCLYPGSRALGRLIRKKYHFSNHFLSMTETLVVSVSFVFGTILRLKEGIIWASIFDGKDSVLHAGEYYDLAMVRSGGGGFTFPHGISDLYVNCLRVVLSFLGNSAAAAALFQVFLQIAAMVFAYLAVRKAAGRFASCIVLLVLAFSNSCIHYVGVINPKCLLTALFLAGLYLVVSFVKASLAGRLIYGGLPGAFLLGIVLGFLCYLEMGCVVLFLFLTGLFTGKSCEAAVGRKQQFGRLLIVIAGGIAGFFGAIAEDASASGVVFYQGLAWWADTYFSPDIDRMRLLEVIYLEYPLFALLFLAASFVAFEFIRMGREQDFSLWFLPCIFITPSFLMDLSIGGFSIVVIFFWSVMAGLGLKNVLFGGQAELMKEKIEEINAAVPVEPVSAPAKEPVSAAVSEEKPRFLENPLPLPKKHVKREMDFDHSVSEADMHYDVEVAEGDDFDR